MVKFILIILVKGYRMLLSPWLGSNCRFEPTCSLYALQALEEHGAARGIWLSTGRLLRCHPWCQGGVDPVPKASGGGFLTRFLPQSVSSRNGDDAKLTLSRQAHIHSHTSKVSHE